MPVSRISHRRPRSAIASSSDGALAVHRVQEALRAVDRERARGQARRRELRGEHAVARRQARVQRLHHRAEVFLQARGLRGRDRQRMTGRIRVEPEQPAHSRRGADGAKRRRAMPPALVVARVHRACRVALRARSRRRSASRSAAPDAPVSSAAASDRRRRAARSDARATRSTCRRSRARARRCRWRAPRRRAGARSGVPSTTTGAARPPRRRPPGRCGDRLRRAGERDADRVEHGAPRPARARRPAVRAGDEAAQAAGVAPPRTHAGTTARGRLRAARWRP